MEFVIRKNATLPLLKMQIVKDGRGTYEDFMSFIETSTIYFSMQNSDNGTIKINTAFAGFVEKIFDEPNANPEYYLYYRFSKKDTSKIGRFEGQFLLRNDSGTLVLPIREKLYINVKESLFDDDLDYNECFVGKYECCIIGPPSFLTPTPTITPTNTATPTITPTVTITSSPTQTIPTIETPTPTNTPTVTLTPSQTDTTISLLLDAFYEPGSVIANYVLTASRNVSEDVSVSFTNILGTITGSPITVITGVTISNGNISGNTIISIDENYNNLDRSSIFSSVTVSYSGGTFNYPINEEPIFITPTPTPTITTTKTPTPTITETLIIDVTPTPTTTETQTNTVTPTQSLTSTVTPTPSVTPNTCNCYYFFNTGTTSAGTINYIDCSGNTTLSTVPPGDYSQVCVRDNSFTASTQIGVSYLVGDCSSGCPIISAATCDVFVLNNTNRVIYSYDSNTNTQIPLPISLSATTPYDIATNDNLLWVFGVFSGGVTGIKEFTINRNPFSATFNRFITLTSSLYPDERNGLAVVDNNTLITSSGVSGTDIVSLDITTTACTPVKLFSLPASRGVRGDLVYTNTGKIIASLYNISAGSGSTLAQFDYSGNLELEFSIGNAGNGFSFYVYNSEFYVVLCATSSATRNKRSLSSPYGSTSQTSMTISNVGMAQPLSCYNINFIPVTPTPTPTLTRTPTLTPSITRTNTVTPSITPSNTATSNTPTPTPTISLTPSITRTQTPSITPSQTQLIYSADSIYNALSATGKTAYLNAVVGNFFNVTETDYLSVFNAVSGASHYGAVTFDQFTGTTNSEFGSPFMNIDTGQGGLAADSYIIGFAFRGSRTASQGLYTLGVRQTDGSLSGGTYSAVTNNVTFQNNVAGAKTYFIRKSPQSALSSTSYLSLYHSSNATQLDVSTRLIYYSSSFTPPYSSLTSRPIAFISLVASTKTW